MKFRLSTFLLVIALIGVATGWLAERRYYSTRLVDETEREGAISSTLSAALHTNMIYTQLDNLSEAEFERKRRSLLFNNVLFLFAHRNNAVDRTIVETANYRVRSEQTSQVLRQAGRSLELLGISNESEFARQFKDTGWGKEWSEGLLNKDGELVDEFTIFVENCLDFNRYEQLRFNQNRTADETITMAECALRLVDNGVLDDKQLTSIEFLIDNIPADTDGRKTEVLQRLAKLNGR